jgi:tetratricopeptide (TPR) repeat protein
MAGGLRGQRRGRLVIVALGPMAGVAAGGLTNLLTMTWNWWMFGGLILMTSMVSAGTLIALPNGNPQYPAMFGTDDSQVDSMLQVPSGTRIFVGRSKELRRLTASTASGSRSGPLMMIIAGMPGTGKTELAICAARALTARYPDGVFWLGLRTYAAAESRLTITSALRTLLNALNVPPDPNITSVAALSRTWRAVTAGKKMLIVLDDADTAEQIRPLLPAADESAILITTRHVLTGLDPDCGITLQPFTQSQAARLAGAVLRRAGLRDPQAVAAIAAEFRLPLAIRQMSDLKAANPALSIPVAPAGTISDETSAAFARSLAALTKPARLVLRRVAHYPGLLITAPIAAVLADQQLDKANQQLATLYQRGLLIADNRSGVGYRMHDAVRATALIESGKHDSTRQMTSTFQRLFRYVNGIVDASVLLLDSSDSVTYLDADKGDPRLPPPLHESDVAVLRWLDQQHADLLAVARRSLSARSPYAWRLAYNLESYQRMRGFYSEIVELSSQALKLAEQADDALGQAAMHQGLGLVDMRTGRYLSALAHFKISLALYIRLSNRTGQAIIHHELCNVHKWLGNLSEARAHANFCLTVALSGDNLVERAFAFSNLGILDRLEGKSTAAREHLVRSKDLFEQVGQRRGIGICHRQLGMLDEHLGHHHDAQVHLDQALALFEDLGDLMNQADTHYNLAVTHRGLGDPTTALHHATIALVLAGQISHVRGQADAHTELACLARIAGDHTSARVHLRQAHDLRRRLRLAHSSEQHDSSPTA